MDITPYLNLMLEKSASDLFFTAGAAVKIKIDGLAVSVGKTELTGDLVKAAAYAIMNDSQIENSRERWSLISRSRSRKVKGVFESTCFASGVKSPWC